MDLQDPIENNLLETQQLRARKRQIISVVFLFAITAVVLYIFFSANDIDEIMTAMHSAIGFDLLMAIVCLIAYIIISPISLCILCKVKKTKISSIQTYFIGASEHFFNNITPYQTGAQPFQVYAFSKEKVETAEGTGLVICNYIAYLIALNALILSSLLFSNDFFYSFREKGIMWIPVLGIIMNLLTLVVFFCLITCKWARDFLKSVIRWLCKFPFIGKKLSKSIPRFGEYCDHTQLGAQAILNNLGAFTIAVVFRLIALLFYYAIPFFILRSLGVHIAYRYIFYTILATCFAVNAVVWIPTPGTSGGIEMSFTVLFTIFAGFNGVVAAAAAILWRALTYYLLIIVSFLEYLALKILQKRESNETSNL